MTPGPAPAAEAGAVDWAALREAARDAMSHAYVPYSGYPVGAAALVDDGRTVSGCNVENASYGLSLCAECGLVSQLQASGGGRLTHFTCVDGNGDVLMPCGRCRQLLYEFGGPAMLLDTEAGVLPLSEMLPLAFGPQKLGPGKPGPEGFGPERPGPEKLG
ncbi:cytidine deaminase [Streptomyces sp. ICN441]|uniref:Cytidine deaminase n=1 Tax=Streptomyces tirandamycinicus TaxID=2174846 RepID=A0A2S1SW25_9ACTN|nr:MULTISPECIES: cytidine deaminase [Streptomyces]AWI30614.1 cytidine deaminase [Streptomyces tirandamycinicus]TFE48706.1 cytidine deaminase [Streptomyces sp. ICN441]